jgi:hypothetical protein
VLLAQPYFAAGEDAHSRQQKEEHTVGWTPADPRDSLVGRFNANIRPQFLGDLAGENGAMRNHLLVHIDPATGELPPAGVRLAQQKRISIAYDERLQADLESLDGTHAGSATVPYAGVSIAFPGAYRQPS